MKTILAIPGWIARCFICFYWTLIVLTYIAGLTVNTDDFTWSNPEAAKLALPLTALIVFWSAAFVLLKILKKRKPLARPVVWIVLAILLIPFAWDSPAPAPRYTRADLKQPEDMRASYETLMRFQKGGDRVLEYEFPTKLPSTKVWTNLLPHAETIEQAWTDCAEGKQYIRDLDQFPAIADFIDYDGPPADAPIPSFRTARDIARTYSAYAKLKVQQGNIDQGLAELTQLHSVTHKSLPHSTLLVSKMINIAIAKLNIRTANQILHHAELDREQLLALKRSFPPLNNEQISMRRPIIMEYDLIQYYAPMLTRDCNLGLVPEHPVARIPFQTASALIYKKNRTLEMNIKLYEPLVAALDIDANPIPAAQAFQERFDCMLNSPRERAGNMVGIWLLSIGVPSFEKAITHSVDVKTWSDLLALEIDERLGGKPELKDVYTGADYAFDAERRCFYSLGPDGQPGTADDIYIDAG